MQEEEVAYRPGQVLAGKYKVENVLGIGGFGAVLAARHIQLEERVAIKVLLPHAAKNSAASERFLREARAAVRIRSDHVAKVTDVGQLEDGVPYMVMEYLDGTDLSSLVKTRGCQLIPDVTEWIIQACEAIAEAHAMGIIHRDLKPANLFLTHKVDGAPCVKVLDFGISKMQNEGDKGMTKTSDVMGSPFYMSPEQMRSTRSVDVRSDIWALGTILFELLAGAPPFDAETMTALVVSIMQEPPRDLAAYRSDVPPALRDTIMRCLEKDPSKRFSDVAELVRGLAPFARSRAQLAMQRVHVILGKPVPSGIRGAVTGDFPPNASPTAVGMPTPTMPGSISQGGISGGGISGGAMSGDTRHSAPSIGPAPTRPGTLVSGDVSAGAFAQSSGSMTQANGPMSSALYHQSNIHATASSPSQSWGGTYTGKKTASKLPMIVGVGALFVVVGAAAGGFIYVRGRGADDRSQSALVVDKGSGSDTSSAKGDSPGVQPLPADTAQPTPPVATTAPTVAPVETANPADNKRPGGRPSGPSKTSKPTAEPAPPTPTPPTPTHTPPPTPTVAPIVKPPAGPFDTQD